MEALRRIEDDGISKWDGLAEKLRHRVVGQDAAIASIQCALDRSHLHDPRRPRASLLFTGPTGVGKTQTAEALASYLSPDAPAFLKVDCGEYTNGHEVASLIGPPLGYIGGNIEPILNPEVIERDGAVVLFDEVEKGHPRLHDLLLQIMEGGEVALLSKGQRVRFQNAVVIMTSNVGSRERAEALSAIGFGDEVSIKRGEKANQTALKRMFKPEFLNRFDDIIQFNSLNDAQYREALMAHVEEANRRYMKIGNVTIRLSDALTDELVLNAPDRTLNGVRPVLRRYEHLVESKLSRMLARVGARGEVFADYDGDVVFYEDNPIETMLALAGEPVCEADK